MRYRLSSRLPVPIERAFAFSVDPRNTASFHGRGTTITKATEGDIGIGTVFRYDKPGRPGWMVVEITEYNPPHSFTTSMRSGESPPQTARMLFEERDAVTVVATEADFALPSWVPARPALERICFAVMWPCLWVATRLGERMARRALL